MLLREAATELLRVLSEYDNRIGGLPFAVQEAAERLEAALGGVDYDATSEPPTPAEAALYALNGLAPIHTARVTIANVDLNFAFRVAVYYGFDGVTAIEGRGAWRDPDTLQDTLNVVIEDNVTFMFGAPKALDLLGFVTDLLNKANEKAAYAEINGIPVLIGADGGLEPL